jgi:hypothetical protein
VSIGIRCFFVGNGLLTLICFGVTNARICSFSLKLLGPRRGKLAQHNQCSLKMGLMSLYLTILFYGSFFAYQDTLILVKLYWKHALIVVRRVM